MLTLLMMCNKFAICCWLVVTPAVYSIYSDKSNNISPLYLKQKISAEEVVANNLQERLIVLKNLFEAVDFIGQLVQMIYASLLSLNFC
jgi:hypothetical protein